MQVSALVEIGLNVPCGWKTQHHSADKFEIELFWLMEAAVTGQDFTGQSRAFHLFSFFVDVGKWVHA